MQFDFLSPSDNGTAKFLQAFDEQPAPGGFAPRGSHANVGYHLEPCGDSLRINPS
jgi:hypothetical protein